MSAIPIVFLHARSERPTSVTRLSERAAADAISRPASRACACSAKLCACCKCGAVRDNGRWPRNWETMSRPAEDRIASAGRVPWPRY